MALIKTLRWYYSYNGVLNHAVFTVLNVNIYRCVHLPAQLLASLVLLRSVSSYSLRSLRSLRSYGVLSLSYLPLVYTIYIRVCVRRKRSNVLSLVKMLPHNNPLSVRWCWWWVTCVDDWVVCCVVLSCLLLLRRVVRLLSCLLLCCWWRLLLLELWCVLLAMCVMCVATHAMRVMIASVTCWHSADLHGRAHSIAPTPAYNTPTRAHVMMIILAQNPLFLHIITPAPPGMMMNLLPKLPKSHPNLHIITPGEGWDDDKTP